jgi:hypothetical protein
LLKSRLLRTVKRRPWDLIELIQRYRQYKEEHQESDDEIDKNAFQLENALAEVEEDWIFDTVRSPVVMGGSPTIPLPAIEGVKKMVEDQDGSLKESKDTPISDYNDLTIKPVTANNSLNRRRQRHSVRPSMTQHEALALMDNHLPTATTVEHQTNTAVASCNRLSHGSSASSSSSSLSADDECGTPTPRQSHRKSDENNQETHTATESSSLDHCRVDALSEHSRAPSSSSAKPASISSTSDELPTPLIPTISAPSNHMQQSQQPKLQTSKLYSMRPPRLDKIGSDRKKLMEELMRGFDQTLYLLDRLEEYMDSKP